MKLKDQSQTPVGGFYYIDPDLGPIRTDGSFRKLVRTVRDYQMARGFYVDNLEMLIEDQICTRQPAGRCVYTRGIGDQISRVVHKVSGAVDKVLGTKFESTARGCAGCGHRRVVLNKLTKPFVNET